MRAVANSSGTGPLNSLLASAEWSRADPRIPASFSTCTRITVRSFSSISRICFIKAAKALRSASKVAAPSGESVRQRFSVLIQSLWETRGVGPYPVGLKRLVAALPRAEPKHNGPEIVRANVADDLVECGEVELTLFGFDVAPSGPETRWCSRCTT